MYRFRRICRCGVLRRRAVERTRSWRSRSSSHAACPGASRGRQQKFCRRLARSAAHDDVVISRTVEQLRQCAGDGARSILPVHPLIAAQSIDGDPGPLRHLGQDLHET